MVDDACGLSTLQNHAFVGRISASVIRQKPLSVGRNNAALYYSNPQRFLLRSDAC
ncbi:Uncharacterised protein [Buttiauxella agrestis]|uniref:Uncharacterized protein n=1 Tax=Buttiauxella agrestis TaxID=82977 RepID=A0A381C8G8_9ENTR|nr:Uncharacterised protein [Buttiauxella agrestis]